MNIVEEITAIAARESARSDEPIRMRLWDAISKLPGTDASGLRSLRWFEYDISIETRADADAEAEILAWLRSLEIAAAPEVAATIPCGGRCVLVRRYWACPGERLVQASTEGPPFRAAAWTRFRSDMAKLVATGKMHPYARGFAHLLVGETSGTILLDSWFVLRTGTPDEQRYFLETIDRVYAPDP